MHEGVGDDGGSVADRCSHGLFAVPEDEHVCVVVGDEKLQVLLNGHLATQDPRQLLHTSLVGLLQFSLLL